MPHLNIYVNEQLFNQIKTTAKIEKTSMSKLIQKKISETFKNSEWPDNYFDLFGSINDETFKRPEQNAYLNDCARENL